jgi:hypothetical protein
VLEAFDKLRFTGNVQAYQIESMGVITELFDSGVTMMDYALSKIMKSFEGKSKTIQYQIAHDINTKDIDDNLNLYDLIQGYCAQIATVGDMQVSVGAVENTTADETRRPKQTGAQQERTTYRCQYCDKKGHTVANCWAKQTDAGEQLQPLNVDTVANSDTTKKDAEARTQEIPRSHQRHKTQPLWLTLSTWDAADSLQEDFATSSTISPWTLTMLTCATLATQGLNLRPSTQDQQQSSHKTT